MALTSLPTPPARAPYLDALPPTYIDVGDLHIFLEEDLAFAARLAASDVPVELQVYPGAAHRFELHAPQSDLAARARTDRLRALRSF